MFYNGREVLSDHFQLILFWVPESSFCKKKRENGIKWEFFPQGGGGASIPTSTNHNTTQKVTFL